MVSMGVRQDGRKAATDLVHVSLPKYDHGGQEQTSSLVLNSLSNLIARSSQTSALVLLAPLLPGYIATSLLNCRQFAIRAYSVAFEKWEVRICCWIGLTRNCDT